MNMRSNKQKLVKNALWGAIIIGVAAYALGPAVANQVGAIKRPAERSAAIDFTLSTLNGAKWSLQEHRGKIVLVNFWATWCPPCRMETPDLVATHKKFSDRGFTVVGVTLDENPAQDVPPFAQRYGVAYPILLPNDEVGGQISSLPTSLLIDGNGRVARRYVGLVTESRLQKDIEALLAEDANKS